MGDGRIEHYDELCSRLSRSMQDYELNNMSYCYVRGNKTGFCCLN